MSTVLWQITSTGVREVTGHPVDPARTVWHVTPVGGVRGRTVHVADLAHTDEIALLMWHERRAELAAVATIEQQVRDRWAA